MRRLLPLLLPVLLPVLLPAAAAPADQRSGTPREAGRATLSADTEARWVPFELTAGNQIRFRMTLDGRTVVAILDTGVSFSVIARTSPALPAARIVARGSASAIGGAVTVGWIPTRSMSLGGLTRTGGGIAVAALPAAATGDAVPVDLLVGSDLVGGQALDIDYAARRFRLLRSGRLPFRGETAPLARSTERRVYESEAMLGGHRLRPMVVDTGDGAAITVTRAGWAASALAGAPTTTALAQGLAGPAVSDLAIVPSVAIGDLDAREVEVRIEPAGGFSQAIGAAGRIGSGLLRRYRVLLDPGAGRMVLAPGAEADRAPLRSTSGLLVGVLPDRLRVLHVMRGSPAEAGGWRAGETICTVDGSAVPAGYAASALAGWSVAAPGTVVRLGLCGGGVRRLVTRRFY